MPAKHIARPFGPARLVFCFAAAILVVLVAWVAVRAGGPAEASRQPTVVLPSMPRVTLAPTSAPSLPVPPSVPPSRTPSRSSRSASVTPSASSTPSSSPSAHPTRSSASPHATPTTTKPVVHDDLAASVRVSASWNAGYVAFVRVQNTGNAARSWSVTVTHQGLTNLRLGSVWGADGSQQGTSLIFTGGTLAAGASATFGYQASANGQDKVRPAGCTVVGGTCAVR